ncbi:hypothetical protein BB559_002353 [Furculomyces boomerangus]|uniref:Protein N-terminal and lysine N-methyltransferase EFM7 n=2 Tax=Harpellales TaxID=61421 RepID=A0A2T9YVX4_9FUNG|nr:hypothetical protein BB559_002353 [Furculomyces boomerangus]PVZ99150.1 hypothetical protein BB558_004853 [Smittium angustum]PWA00457.1 hypothetical protein BB558_003464 [Smittium angustum]
MDSDDNIDIDIFAEPEGYYPEAPSPTKTSYSLKTPINGKKDISLQLVGSHPLWGHHLWNSSIIMAQYIEENNFIQGKNVLELGAASGLPSLVSVAKGANKVVITDYPDPDLVGNILYNANLNFSEKVTSGDLSVEGYIWGKSVDDLVKHLAPNDAFDILLLSDLVFNHSEHNSLLKTCKELLSSPKNQGNTTSPERMALVFFTHHRPWLAEKDMMFFTTAKTEFGFKVEEIIEKYTGPMFENDPGDKTVRGTVHGYKMTL